LVTPTGETIQRHQEIIKSTGSVCWGWWAKPDEQVSGEFLQIQRYLATPKQELRIFLIVVSQKYMKRSWFMFISTGIECNALTRKNHQNIILSSNIICGLNFLLLLSVMSVKYRIILIQEDHGLFRRSNYVLCF
jgi:hypothetical protein